MTILNYIKDLAGIGAPKISVEGAERVARPGDVLRGVVVLEGGDHEVTVHEVTVRLEEQRLTYTAPVPTEDPERLPLRTLAHVRLDLAQQALVSGQRIERRFELPVPAQLEPSEGPLGHALVAEAELAGINPVAILPMTILPSDA